jgi:hypothetical protein
MKFDRAKRAKQTVTIEADGQPFNDANLITAARAQEMAADAWQSFLQIGASYLCDGAGNRGYYAS